MNLVLCVVARKQTEAAVEGISHVNADGDVVQPGCVRSVEGQRVKLTVRDVRWDGAVGDDWRGVGHPPEVDVEIDVDDDAGVLVVDHSEKLDR